MTRQGIAVLCFFWIVIVSAVAAASAQVVPSESRESAVTLRVRDMNGRWREHERRVTQWFETDGHELVVSETYAPGEVEYDAGPALRSRVLTSTTAMPDGGRIIVEEVEVLNPAAPSEPFRVTRRTVTTVRRAGPDRWATERQVFERDINGRMTVIQTETEETIGDAPPVR